MTAVLPNVKTPSVKQTPPLLQDGKKSTLRGRNKVIEDATILRALQEYVPDTPEEKRLVRKIDFMLLPVLWFMYILAHLDRSNIANANAAGMSEELGLSDNRMSYSLGYHVARSDVPFKTDLRQNTQCSFRSSS